MNEQQSAENDALRQIVRDYAEPVTASGRDSLDQTVERLAEYVAHRIAATLASIEEHEGKVPGYFAERVIPPGSSA
jgi:hypothetical protein